MSSIVRRLSLLWRRWRRLRAPLSSMHVLRAALVTMRAKRYCVLATTDERGSVDARVVQPFAPHLDSLTVRFGTSARSRKARQIRESGRATLVYEDDARTACVTLVGQARLIADLPARRQSFPGMFYAFFPEGPDQDDYTLVEVVPERVEVLDFARRITPEPFGLCGAVLERRDGRWVLVG